MGRELRRKEERKNKNIVKDKELDTSIKGGTIVKVVCAIVLILLVIYYILAVFVTKEIDVSGNQGNNTTNNSATNVANKILASNIFNQKEDTYYVYFYDFNEEEKELQTAISSKTDMKIYRVDTSSSLNSKYVTEETGNPNVTNLESLKVKNPTLMEITNDKVTKYYEGKDSIISFLNG